MQYEAQLAAKMQQVFTNLSHCPEDKIKPILPSPKTLSYRTRAQLKTNGERLGFMANQGRTLVDVASCTVLNDTNQNTLRNLREQLPNKHWKTRKKQSLTTLDIDTQHEGASVNERLPFMQGNAEQNRQMQTWLTEGLTPLDKNTGVLELFCGSGNFTQTIAGLGFDTVHAIDVVEQATAHLRAQNTPNIHVQTLDLFAKDALLKLPNKLKTAQTLVLDPPRDGYKALPQLLKMLPKVTQIFYISCNLATFKRDTQAALGLGFEWQGVQPIDLFPQTPHIELMGHLTRVTREKKAP